MLLQTGPDPTCLPCLRGLCGPGRPDLVSGLVTGPAVLAHADLFPPRDLDLWASVQLVQASVHVASTLLSPTLFCAPGGGSVHPPGSLSPGARLAPRRLQTPWQHFDGGNPGGAVTWGLDTWSQVPSTGMAPSTFAPLCLGTRCWCRHTQARVPGRGAAGVWAQGAAAAAFQRSVSDTSRGWFHLRPDVDSDLRPPAPCYAHTAPTPTPWTGRGPRPSTAGELLSGHRASWGLFVSFCF